MRLRASLTVLLLALGGTLAAAPPASAVDVTVSRIAGGNQYETAVAVSRALVPDPARSSRSAVIVSGSDSADVLVGPEVAAANSAPGAPAPILMVESGKGLPRIVEDELRRLQLGKVTIIGGTTKVSSAVQDRIRTFVPTVERIAGADRYATAVDVSQRLGTTGATAFTEVFVVTGESPTNATAGVLAAAARGARVLLTRKDSLPVVTRDELRRLGYDQVHIVGGTDVISSSVRRQIAALGGNIFEFSGRDKYEVQAGLFDYFDAGGSPATLLVSGETWQNALVAAPYAQSRAADQATVLVRRDCVPGVTLDYLASVGYVDRDRTVIGGTGNVSDAAAQLRRC